MFFHRKRKVVEKPTEEQAKKFYVFVTVTKMSFTCHISYTEGMHPTNFTEISYAILEKLMEEYCVFTVRHFQGEAEELEKCITYLKNQSTTEFLSDEKEIIIEKRKGVHSFLLKDCFHNVEPGQLSFPMNDFTLYGYHDDIMMKANAEEQYTFFQKEKPDIRVDYEDHFEELQSLSIIIKKDVICPEKLVVFIIRVLRSYGKDIELNYKEEKEISYLAEQCDCMLFFQKRIKKEQKPVPYEIYIGRKNDTIEFGLYYWSQDDPLIDYLNIAFEILEKILEDYYLFICEKEFEPKKHNRMLQHMKTVKNAEYVYDDEGITEKQKGFFSNLLKAYFQSENSEEPEHDFRAFYIYGFLHDVPMERTAKAQDEFLYKRCEDIFVEYEELFEGPTINIWIKKASFDIYELMCLSMEIIRKHGKNLSIFYMDNSKEK